MSLSPLASQAPLELWLLAHRSSSLGATSCAAPVRRDRHGTLRLRAPLTHTELWDKLIAESGLEWIAGSEARAA